MEEIATIAAPETPVAENPTPETPETPTPETPTPETLTPETPETPAESTEEEPLPGEPEEEALETDARKMDDRTRKMLGELKKTNPAAAKELANQFFRRLAYEKEFPTVQDARQAKATIESLGGEEGISSLQEEIRDTRAEAEQFANGKRELFETLYEANPEAAIKQVRHGIDIMTEAGNIEGLDSIILAPMVKRLQQVGLHSHLLKAAEFIKEGKGQEAYNTLGAIGEWLAKLTGDAEKMASTRVTKDPREEELNTREQRIQQQEKENYDRSIGAEVNELNNRALSKTIGNFFKEVGLDHEGRREFTQAVLQKIWAAMKADKVFQRQAHAIKAKGDKTRAAEFINSKFAELAPRIFRAHKNTMYPRLAQTAAKATPTLAPTNGKPAPKAATATAAATGAPIKVRQVPGPEEVDWNKTPDILWARGKAHLKNGKYVDFY